MSECKYPEPVPEGPHGNDFADGFNKGWNACQKEWRKVIEAQKSEDKFQAKVADEVFKNAFTIPKEVQKSSLGSKDSSGKEKIIDWLKMAVDSALQNPSRAQRYINEAIYLIEAQRERVPLSEDECVKFYVNDQGPYEFHNIKEQNTMWARKFFKRFCAKFGTPPVPSVDKIYGMTPNEIRDLIYWAKQRGWESPSIS